MTTLNTDTLVSIQLNQVIEQLNDMDTQTVIDIYNSYADENSYERIYDNDEDTINDLYDSAWTAISLTNHDGYRDSHDYFTYNGYGLMTSFEYVDSDNSPIDIEELAEWISNNELYDDFDIEVTTLDDMLASIEDNITDDEELLSELVDYLRLSLYSEDEVLNDGDDWNEYRINHCMDWLKTGFDYNQLNMIITDLSINYNK